MATKEQVLKLLEKGLNPQQIAKKLGCKDAYVRATRRRAEVPGYGKHFPSRKRSTERKKERYRTDSKFRAKHNASTLKYWRERYYSDPEYRERLLANWRRRYYARKAEQSQSAN